MALPTDRKLADVDPRIMHNLKPREEMVRKTEDKVNKMREAFKLKKIGKRSRVRVLPVSVPHLLHTCLTRADGRPHTDAHVVRLHS